MLNHILTTLQAFLDAILYGLASPLAREIIDSLRTEPGEWRERTIHGVPELTNGKGRLTVTVDCERYCHHGFGASIIDAAPISRLALRRAVNEWRKTHEPR